MSSEERERLEQEVRRREQQVAEMREQVDMKTQETERLQREVEEARAVQERESSRQLNAFSVKEVDLDENASENGQIATGTLRFDISKLKFTYCLPIRNPFSCYYCTKCLNLMLFHDL